MFRHFCLFAPPVDVFSDKHSGDHLGSTPARNGREKYKSSFGPLSFRTVSWSLYWMQTETAGKMSGQSGMTLECSTWVWKYAKRCKRPKWRVNTTPRLSASRYWPGATDAHEQNVWNDVNLGRSACNNGKILPEASNPQCKYITHGCTLRIDS